jgi:hypothetical protein
MKTLLIHNSFRGIKLFTAAIMIALTPWQFSMASVQGARGIANALFVGLKSRSYDVRDSFSQGLLRYGQSVYIATTLYSGNTYTLCASGCEDAYDVDIAVYDQNANRIGADADANRLAVVNVTPRWSGTYYIKVTMSNSTANGAHYVLQYAFRQN